MGPGFGFMGWGGVSIIVPVARLELATSGLEVLRAIQLRHTGKITLSGGVEPPALRLTAARSDQLSYKSNGIEIYSPYFFLSI